MFDHEILPRVGSDAFSAETLKCINDGERGVEVENEKAEQDYDVEVSPNETSFLCFFSQYQRLIQLIIGHAGFSIIHYGLLLFLLLPCLEYSHINYFRRITLFRIIYQPYRTNYQKR